MSSLSSITVAVVATHGFEDDELSSPIAALTEAGAEVHVLSPDSGTIEGKKGSTVQVDRTTAEADAANYDCLLLPGGTANADSIRTDAPAVAFVKQIVEATKPVGVICHGGWILCDADVLRGRTLTSYHSMKTDLVNAGATWVDEEVCVDGTLISSRTPADLPAFNDAILRAFAPNS
ncbi:Putative cysteine protease YraA [Corynebacterium ciconiae DSM 44920]|uniref:type 1 glutamine amidotransferase domain-containing protein n=1 Tax=Corynebacterium ciconiae TaxID=227319 RepID=UPI000370B66B|nr:type 1 glutamine amidotransferase domain-containing protein [Corynebacterium ciconiae]WKD60839.1 Putative cysteine protease YraA [Corynebacterium ciconiae DSM 44920]